MITLKNPLSIEEKLQTTRLIGHDSVGYITRLLGLVGNRDTQRKQKAMLHHISNIEHTIRCMVNDEIIFSPTFRGGSF